ncbi:hypothetical protein P7C71_g1061, partial [Lecanoromycetidae sp. Uapishka_2]
MVLRKDQIEASLLEENKLIQSGKLKEDTPLDLSDSFNCSPEVLEVILTFLYTEKTDFPLAIAIDVLFAANYLLIEKLKLKAAVVITEESHQEAEEAINIYDVVRAGWLTRTPRLEEFGARYIAYRLEDYIDEDDFADLVRESAARIKGRQETDTIELLDDIRYYLSERYRLRFEDSGIDMLEEDAEHEESVNVQTDQATDSKGPEDEAIDVSQPSIGDAPTAGLDGATNQFANGKIFTLDGDLAGDELEQDALNYQILLGKIDSLLDRLKLEA